MFVLKTSIYAALAVAAIAAPAEVAVSNSVPSHSALVKRSPTESNSARSSDIEVGDLDDLMKPGKKVVTGSVRMEVSKSVFVPGSLKVDSELKIVLGSVFSSKKEKIQLNVEGDYNDPDHEYNGDLDVTKGSQLVFLKNMFYAPSISAHVQLSSAEEPYYRIKNYGTIRFTFNTSSETKQSMSIYPFKEFVNDGELIVSDYGDVPRKRNKVITFENKLGTMTSVGNTIKNTGEIYINATSLSILNSFEDAGPGKIEIDSSGQLILLFDDLKDANAKLLPQQEIDFIGKETSIFFGRNTYMYPGRTLNATISYFSHSNAFVFEDKVKQVQFNATEHQVVITLRLPTGTRREFVIPMGDRTFTYQPQAFRIVHSPNTGDKFGSGSVVYYRE